jgi:hypothetical protein
MTTVVDADEAIFASTGQAVHVAFLIMSQPAQQDAPLRKALIRVMESIQLTNNQRNWLDDLRGTASGSVNFAGLSSLDVRAQCVMITQAVKDRLPETEMWVLQAKFGQTDFESLDDDQLPRTKEPRRRYAFSRERIAAIKGLSDWFAPMFPRLKPLAIDCLLGRIFVNHKKLDIGVRDLADSFGGSHMKYQRATVKMKRHIAQLEQLAFDRLEPFFIEHGVTRCNPM